jgi:hypothetical protein
MVLAPTAAFAQEDACIVGLRPGTYTVTFTLTGFNTVKREGIEVTGRAVFTVNAEMKVGSLQETITVTGETPIVDVQSVKRQTTISNETMNAIPCGVTASTSWTSRSRRF